jgi:hypothetical protein
MTYVQICDANATNDELARGFREIAAAFREFATLKGYLDDAAILPRKFFRGQCQVHREIDAFYIQISDLEFATYLAGRQEFVGRFRHPSHIRIFEEV